jgi:hypothetical protein
MDSEEEETYSQENENADRETKDKNGEEDPEPPETPAVEEEEEEEAESTESEPVVSSQHARELSTSSAEPPQAPMPLDNGPTACPPIQAITVPDPPGTPEPCTAPTPVESVNPHPGTPKPRVTLPPVEPTPKVTIFEPLCPPRGCKGRGDTPLRMLDLFSGTGSIARICADRGYDVTRIDIDPRFDTDIQIDIRYWRYWEYPVGWFAVVAASPPCTEYSIAMTCRKRELERADKLVEKALEIINYFQPTFWFLENPQWGLLKSRPFMKKKAFVDVDYCQFSDLGYMKPTRIWGPVEIGLLRSVKCDPQTCPNMLLRSNG